MSIQSFPNVQDGNYSGVTNVFLVGLSSDVKPLNIPSGSLFLETDTENYMHFDGGAWVSPIDNIVVRGLSDFPAPVAGIIQLAAATNYLISGTVDIGTNTIAWGARSGIGGTNRVNDRLVSSTTGTMFTVGPGDVVGFFHEIALNCPNGTLIDASGASVTFIDVAFGNTKNAGNIALSGAFSFGLRTSSMVNAFTSSGFTFTGTSTSSCRIFDNLARNNAGTMFDFGTASFAAIDIGRNIIDTPAGQTFVSGATGGGNVTPGGGGLLLSNIFIGPGTPVSTITNTDPRWEWLGNVGVVSTPFLISDTTGLQFALDAKQALVQKDTASGYAGLNAVSRTTKGVDTTDYILSTDASKGFVLKDDATPPHYWRMKVKIPAGTIDLVDLGTTKP